MSDITNELLESQGNQIVRVMTVSDREDPCPAFTILRIEEIRTTRGICDVSTIIANPPRERCKIAASMYRLSYIDFHTDDRRDCRSDVTGDYCTACNTHDHVWHTGGRL